MKSIISRRYDQDESHGFVRLLISEFLSSKVSCVLISWNDDDATKRAPAPVDVHFALKAICESRSLRVSSLHTSCDIVC